MIVSARRLAAAVFFVCAFALPSTAEPIQVTGGGTFLYWDGAFTSALLTGPGLQVGAEGTGGGIQILLPGPRNLDGTFTIRNLGAVHTWSPTIDGQKYEAYLDGSFNFDAEPLLIPPVTAANQPVSFSTPFTMTGRVRGTTGAFGTGSVLFDVLLFGSGTATASGFSRRPEDNLYVVGGVNYQFSDVAATPEPATLLLMGTGLAGLMARRRRAQTS